VCAVSISTSAPIPPTMSRLGHSTLLHALTPLTSSDSSPPGKLPSPRSAKPSYDTMNATAPSRVAPPSAPDNGAETITPVNTPPETRISVFPADGALAKRLIYDPSVDPKLDKKARNSRQAQYKTVVDKVREGYT
jgi:histone-lysine N-methyltransferase SETD1